MHSLIDAPTVARLLIADPLTRPNLKKVLRTLLDDADWQALLLTLAQVAVDDLEQRTELILALHKDRVVDAGRVMCARCVEIAPCRTERAARGVH